MADHFLWVRARHTGEGTEDSTPALRRLTPPEPVLPAFSLWRHYKGGIYVVLGLVVSPLGWPKTSSPDLVAYASTTTGDVWLRPLPEWHEVVDSLGLPLRRFRLLQETDRSSDRGW